MNRYRYTLEVRWETRAVSQLKFTLFLPDFYRNWNMPTHVCKDSNINFGSGASSSTCRETHGQTWRTRHRDQGVVTSRGNHHNAGQIWQIWICFWGTVIRNWEFCLSIALCIPGTNSQGVEVNAKFVPVKSENHKIVDFAVSHMDSGSKLFPILPSIIKACGLNDNGFIFIANMVTSRDVYVTERKRVRVQEKQKYFLQIAVHIFQQGHATVQQIAKKKRDRGNRNVDESTSVWIYYSGSYI